tara:strand:- start:230 stop:652 length:423 start_codon:yes stop_codon:yes gene_type:complete
MSDDLKTDLELLKRDVSQISSIFTKLDTTIDKLGEVSTNLSKIVAVHEAKLEKQDNTDKQLQSLIDVLFQKLEDYRKITEDNKDELRKEIRQAHTCGMDEMKEMKKALVSRVSELEKWKWMVVGGAILFGYLISMAQKYI